MGKLTGKRAVVMGLGRFGGGVGASRFLARQGARVLVTDLLPADQLAKPLGQLEGLPIDYRLGEHRESDFSAADLIVVNPAVDRRNNRFIAAAETASVPLTSEIRLLVERLPNRQRTIGVTGTAGKSTVVAMIGHALAKLLGEDSFHVGGNIGGSLLEALDHIKPEDWVVLELSSFMLEDLAEIRWSPHIAIVTNIMPNHLDRYASMDAYIEAKKGIIRYQRDDDGDFAILAPSVLDWEPNDDVREWLVRHQAMTNDLPQVAVPGEHNRFNAELAYEACLSAVEETWLERSDGGLVQFDMTPVADALADFPGLPHRLQFAGEHNGVKFYNDSKCTIPEGAVLAIDSFDPRTVHIILGGYDKQADLKPMAEHAGQRCAAIYTIGATGDRLADAAERVAGACPVHRCGELQTAVAQAVANASDGQVVLLSPGCASWDQFDNYEQRGETFIQALPGRT